MDLSIITRIRIDNFFVYVTDQQSADYFRKHHLSHVCYFDGQIDTKNTSTYALWGSTAFKDINNKKMFLANKILHLNYSVSMSEIDVVWFQDPQKHFEEFIKKSMILSLKDYFMQLLMIKEILDFFIFLLEIQQFKL